MKKRRTRWIVVIAIILAALILFLHLRGKRANEEPIPYEGLLYARFWYPDGDASADPFLSSAKPIVVWVSSPELLSLWSSISSLIVTEKPGYQQKGTPIFQMEFCYTDGSTITARFFEDAFVYGSTAYVIPPDHEGAMQQYLQNLRCKYERLFEMQVGGAVMN